MQLARTRHRVQTLNWRQLSATLLTLLALALAVLGWLAYTELARTEPLVVAAADIRPGTRLQPSDLAVIPAPVLRDPALQGVDDPARLAGQFTRVALSRAQIVRPELVQTQPLTAHVFVNAPLPDEVLRGVAFPLARTHLGSITSQDRVNLLVLLDPTRGADPAVRAGAVDTAAGQGARVVRVLHDLNILHVSEDTVVLEVTPAESQFLWSLQAAELPLVGELAVTPAAPLGVLVPASVVAPSPSQEAAP